MSRRRSDTSYAPTEEQAAQFDLLCPMLDSMIEEIRGFVKKKDAPLNELKVKLINRRLEDIKRLLDSDSSATYLDLLDEETLPLTSDAALVLGQFKAAMDQFRGKHCGYDSLLHGDRWFTKEDPRPAKY